MMSSVGMVSKNYVNNADIFNDSDAINIFS